MARMIVQVFDCEARRSPQCEGTFQRPMTRGRPPKACPTCHAYKAPRKSREAVQAPKVVTPKPTEGTCGCGAVFAIEPGPGRKRKCDACREAGTVYRMDDDGILQAIQKDQLEREEQERKDAAGKARALALFERMQPLLRKTDRVVIPH
jgi:hypothetical protein